MHRAQPLAPWDVGGQSRLEYRRIDVQIHVVIAAAEGPRRQPTGMPQRGDRLARPGDTRAGQQRAERRHNIGRACARGHDGSGELCRVVEHKLRRPVPDQRSEIGQHRRRRVLAEQHPEEHIGDSLRSQPLQRLPALPQLPRQRPLGQARRHVHEPGAPHPLPGVSAGRPDHVVPACLQRGCDRDHRQHVSHRRHARDQNAHLPSLYAGRQEQLERDSNSADFLLRPPSCSGDALLNRQPRGIASRTDL